MEGQRRSFRLVVLCMLVALLLAAAPGRSTAQGVLPDCTVSACQVFVPNISKPFVPPTLLSPGLGVVRSVSPLLTWTMPAAGVYNIQISKNPDLRGAVIDTTLTNNDPLNTTGQYLLTFNLDNSTRYFWRVGLRTPGQSSYTYSVISNFTTGSKGSLPTPATPALAEPANQATFPMSSTVSLSWQAQPNVTYFRVKAVEGTDFDNGPTFSSEIVAGNTTSATLPALGNGKSYSWSVRAWNEYGWSNWAPTRIFSSTAVITP